MAIKKAIKITDTQTGGARTYEILHNRRFTPSGMRVAYAGYYEIACHPWYMRVDKESLKVTGNLTDVNVFEVMNRYSAQIIPNGDSASISDKTHVKDF